MGRFRKRCLLCKNEEMKTKREVLFHVFTKSTATFHAWIEVCNLDAKVDYVANVYICSDHFLESDYKTTTRGKVLINGSIPSVNVPNKTFGKQIQSTRQTARLPKSSSTSQPSIKDNNKTSGKDINKIAIKTEVKTEVIEFEEHEIKTEPKNDNPALDPHHDNGDWTAVVKMEQDPMSIAAEIEIFSSESSNKHFSSKESTISPRTTEIPRKCIPNPRYVGDIRLNHFDNRQRIKTMDMVRNTVTKMRRKIKLLKQQNNRLNAKVKFLKNIVKESNIRKTNCNGIFQRK